MWLNHLKISFRSLTRSKSYTLLNLLGLSSGLVVFILITLYTSHELSYDNYHEKGDRIYGLYKQDEGHFYQGTDKYAVVPFILAPTMMQDFPEVEAFTHMGSRNNVIMRVGDETFLEKKVHLADPAVFDLFTFDLLAGNRDELLNGPDAMVISESMAIKYFGKTDVIGEVIHFRNELPFRITGVIRDMPVNSHMLMHIILNFEGVVRSQDGPERLVNWNQSSYQSYVLLKPGVEAATVQEKLPVLREKYADDPIDEDGQESVYHLQALRDVHFSKDVIFDIAPKSDKQAIYVYAGIALMILIIALINYVNLATAKALNRAREVGIRKVIGAQRSSLIFSFITESGLLVFTAIALSLVVLLFLVPPFASFIDKPLVLELDSARFWFFLLSLAVSMTIISATYPALILSGFKPVAALKTRGSNRGGNAMFRNILVVFQFTISCALILGAATLTQQLNFIQNMDTGYSRDQIVVMRVRDKMIREQLDVFKEELRRISGVSAVSSSNSLPNNFTSSSNAEWVGQQDEEVTLYTNTADYSFVDLYELELAEGRGFDESIATDETAVLLNEAAVKALGWENPVGKQMIRWWGDTGRVVGVLKDFHLHSVHLAIEPMQIFQRSGQFHVSVKMEGDHVEGILSDIESVYQSFNPVYPIDYSFFDDVFDRAYMSEIKAARLAKWFTALAIVIACLGLYGLATHKVQHRLKEVGIRKVLGASLTELLRLLSRDFVRLLLISFLIAAPVAWLVMDDWLNGFAYHIEMGIGTYLLALVLMVLMAGLTVGYRTYAAAVRNPVQALRDE